jgi:hypothetical protein
MFTVMEAERADHKPAAQAGAAPLRIPTGKQIHLYSNATYEAGQYSCVPMLSLWLPTEEKDKEKGRGEHST